jgi:hypothetical protein
MVLRRAVAKEKAMTTQASSTNPAAPRLPVVPLGLSLSVFLVISYVLCVLLGLIWWDAGLHRPWLQFLPGVTWLTWPSFLLGLVEVIAYGWYAALVFAPLFNFFVARRQ